MRPASPIAKTRGRDLALKIPRSHRVNYLRYLERLLIVGILVISTMPLFAQAQPDPAKLKADAPKGLTSRAGFSIAAETLRAPAVKREAEEDRSH